MGEMRAVVIGGSAEVERAGDLEIRKSIEVDSKVLIADWTVGTTMVEAALGLVTGGLCIVSFWLCSSCSQTLWMISHTC